MCFYERSMNMAANLAAGIVTGTGIRRCNAIIRVDIDVGISGLDELEQLIEGVDPSGCLVYEVGCCEGTLN